MTYLPADREFTALLAMHGASLSRLAASYAKEPAERDDLFQDIAIAIWRALPSFRGECSERTFLFRIAHNRGMSYLARRRLPVTNLDEDSMLQDTAPNPEQALAREQQGQRLMDAVQRLPMGYRQVVTLALEGLSYDQIAEVLGISESNVGARLTRARDMLRNLLR